jgi:hypothetical protein
MIKNVIFKYLFINNFLEGDKFPAWEDLCILNNKNESEMVVDLINKVNENKEILIASGTLNISKLPVQRPETIKLNVKDSLIGELYIIIEKFSYFKTPISQNKELPILRENEPS